MGKIQKTIARKLLKVKPNENINSAIDRHVTKLKKKIDKRSYSQEDLKKGLMEAGIKKNDNIIIHSSWRKFYSFKGSPNDVIDTIIDIIGEEGTILMPSFGKTREYFDVSESPSYAGVLSEVFRTQYPSVRSACTHSAVSALGPLAKELTEDHFYSEYGFDNYSPYYKISKTPNSKVLFMGLGEQPTKIALFHSAGYILKDKDPYLTKLISHKYEATLVVDGKSYNKAMVIRKPGHPNDNNVFKSILSDINSKKHFKVQNLDLVVFDVDEGLDKAVEYAKKGIYCYKNSEV